MPDPVFSVNLYIDVEAKGAYSAELAVRDFLNYSIGRFAASYGIRSFDVIDADEVEAGTIGEGDDD